jgi:broad specificity phosphatase PhoE
MKHVLLIRHPESSKNIQDRFASQSGEEPLTRRGQDDVRNLAHEVKQFASHLRADEISVHASSSTRAMGPARFLADQIGGQLLLDANMASIVNAETSGRSFAQLALEDAALAREMNLYRAGVFSSYAIRKISKNTRPYEARVQRALESVRDLNNDLAVIVAHQSFMTFALIYVARLCGYYPSDFFGKVHLELGSCALLSCSDESGWAIHFADLAVRELNTIGRMLAGI